MIVCNMKDYARDALTLAERLIGIFGPRPAGSEQSRGCANALKAEAETISDSVHTEDFSVHPGSFLGWIRILVILYAASVAGMWSGYYLISVLLIISGIFILVFQFFLYREILDPFYPGKTGRNVLASIEPAGELRGELIISGHHDSARVFNFLVYQPALYPLRVNGGIASLVLLGVTSAVMAAIRSGSGSPDWRWIPSLVFSVLFLLVVQLWWFASGEYTEGAGDNLASSAAAWEFLRFCSLEKKNGNGFRHLKITAASWDAEEAGLRGSRAWRIRRMEDIRASTARTSGSTSPGALVDPDLPVWNLNLECLYREEDLFLLTSDINGSVKLSSDLAGRCAGLLATGSGLTVDCKPIAFLTGGTDAGETARAGVQSTTLMGMPWGNNDRAAVYHTPRDTIGAVSEKAVSAALKLCADLAEELDGELTAL